MKKLKIWLWDRFLPAWAKSSVYKENVVLRERVSALESEIARLNAYIDGLEIGIKSQRRIQIKNEVSR